MMDQMVRDVEKDMAEAKRDEEEAQKDYEQEMSDAATKRSDDSKLIVTKEGEKAEKTGALDVLESQIANLHKTCDFLIEHYAGIKEERLKEEEGLKSAKMVLAGAKLGFLQQS